MELRQLEYFMITCEKGSFNQAAECLYTTQPNVSKVISSLEKELGRPLFERSSRGIHITPYGETVREYAQNILHNISLINSLTDHNQGKKFSLATYPSNMISRLLTDFYKEMGIATTAKELGVKPMATFVTGALGGVDPSIMGVGPVASTKKALAKANMTIDDMDLIEANEAFAAQSVAVARDLKFDMSKVNVNGGAIALGHPVGASGCRILVTLLHEMQKRDAKMGLATLCIGGGMGCTTIVERD